VSLVTAAPRAFMSGAAYLAWETRQRHRHALVKGLVRAKSSTNVARMLIAENTIVALKQRLLRGCCDVFSSQIKVRTGERSYRYPDVTVDCGAPSPADLFADKPTVLVEVSPRSIELLDELAKLEEYQRLDSVKHVVLLSQRPAAGRVWTRTAGGWSTQDLEGLEGELALPHLGLALPMAELYEGVAFEEPAEE